jgi:hypothetical protein
MCRVTDIDTHVNVSGHILRIRLEEGYPTDMPLAPDHVRLSRNVLASEPCLRNQMVSIVGSKLLTLLRAHHSRASSQTRQDSTTCQNKAHRAIPISRRDTPGHSH